MTGWQVPSSSMHRILKLAKHRLILTIAVVQLLYGSAHAIDFAHDVAPILRKHCVKCHGGAEAEGGFSINTRALFLESDAARPGSSAESRFIELIRSTDDDERMPPKDLPPLSPEETETLAEWVDEGLPWTEAFTFAESTYQAPLLPREVSLPGPADANPIDQIIDDYLNQRGLPPIEPVDDATFLRRASLDLIGLLPTPEHLAEYLSDASKTKRERLIDQLLENEIAYTEHWLTFWNDLLRNDYDGTGFITGGRKQISQWLYRSLIDNKPFDQFTRELVAPPSDASRGFIDGIKWRGNVSAGQTNEIQFAQSVAQSFLGINLKCASCHDSFIDRWKLSDAYSLAAVYSQQPLEIHRCDKPIGKTAKPGWLFPELGEIQKDAPRDQRLKQLADLVTDPNNGRYSRTIVNRLWAQMMGRGIVHPLDAMHTEPWNEDLLDFLANFLVESGYDLKAVLRLIAISRAYGSRSESLDHDPQTELEYVYRGRRAKRMTAEQYLDAVWQLSGAGPNEFDAPVTRGKVDKDQVDQIDLKGEWIWGDSAADGKAPAAGEQLVFRKTIDLPAGVVSGAAVVTADNSFELYIGRRKVAAGDDWTRPQTIAMGGRFKKGNNEFVIVARNAGESPNLAGLFFEARLILADGSVVEVASDASWQYTDGPPVGGREGRLGRIVGPWKGIISLGRPDVYSSVDAPAKRALATGVSRESSMVRASLLKSDFLMRSLGRPNRDQIVTSRPADLTTLEAIDLANRDTLAGAIASGAERLRANDPSTRDFVSEIYRFALSREPTGAEWKTIAEELGDDPTAESIEDLLWAICVMPEFMMVR